MTLSIIFFLIPFRATSLTSFEDIQNLILKYVNSSTLVIVIFA